MPILRGEKKEELAEAVRTWLGSSLTAFDSLAFLHTMSVNTSRKKSQEIIAMRELVEKIGKADKQKSLQLSPKEERELHDLPYRLLQQMSKTLENFMSEGNINDLEETTLPIGEVTGSHAAGIRIPLKKVIAQKIEEILEAAEDWHKDVSPKLHFQGKRERAAI